MEQEGLPLVRCGRAPTVATDLWNDLPAGLRDGWALAKWSAGQPRLVLAAHSRVGFIAGSLAHFRTGAPLVTFFHFLANRPGLYHRLVRATRALPVFNSRKTCLHYGFDPARSMIISPPIDWPAIPPPARGPGRQRLVACGLFVRNKHLDVVVKAFAQLRRPDLELHIFGLADEPSDPVCQGELVGAAREWPNVILHKYNPRWSQELGDTDIFVHLGQPEGFGIVMLEAFAAGCRLVVLPETFLEDLPDPWRTRGIERARSLAIDDVAAALAASLAAGPDRGLWRDRQAVAERFSLTHSTQPLVAAYQRCA